MTPRQLLEALTFAKWLWLVIGTVCLIIGSLTNRNPLWIAPMVTALIPICAEGLQERRVRKLEKGPRA